MPKARPDPSVGSVLSYESNILQEAPVGTAQGYCGQVAKMVFECLKEHAAELISTLVKENNNTPPPQTPII